MATRLSLVQLGKGTVGATLIEQIRAARPALLKRLGVDLVYAGIAGRTSGAFDSSGLDLTRWKDAVGSGKGLDGRALLAQARGVLSGTAVLVDATAGEGMAEVYCDAFTA